MKMKNSFSVSIIDVIEIKNHLGNERNNGINHILP